MWRQSNLFCWSRRVPCPDLCSSSKAPCHHWSREQDESCHQATEFCKVQLSQGWHWNCGMNAKKSLTIKKQLEMRWCNLLDVFSKQWENTKASFLVKCATIRNHFSRRYSGSVQSLMTVVKPKPKWTYLVNQNKRNKPIRTHSENMQPEPSAEKHVTGVKRGKTHVSQVTIGFGFASDWLINAAGLFLLVRFFNQI